MDSLWLVPLPDRSSEGAVGLETSIESSWFSWDALRQGQPLSP